MLSLWPYIHPNANRRKIFIMFYRDDDLCLRLGTMNLFCIRNQSCLNYEKSLFVIPRRCNWPTAFKPKLWFKKTVDVFIRQFNLKLCTKTFIIFFTMKPTIIVLLSVVTLIVSQKTVPCEKEIKTCFAVSVESFQWFWRREDFIQFTTFHFHYF